MYTYTNNTNITAKTHNADCQRRTPRSDKGENPDVHKQVQIAISQANHPESIKIAAISNQPPGKLKYILIALYIYIYGRYQEDNTIVVRPHK